MANFNVNRHTPLPGQSPDSSEVKAEKNPSNTKSPRFTLRREAAFRDIPQQRERPPRSFTSGRRIEEFIDDLGEALHDPLNARLVITAHPKDSDVTPSGFVAERRRTLHTIRETSSLMGKPLLRSASQQRLSDPDPSPETKAGTIPPEVEGMSSEKPKPANITDAAVRDTRVRASKHQQENPIREPSAQTAKQADATSPQGSSRRSQQTTLENVPPAAHSPNDINHGVSAPTSKEPKKITIRDGMVKYDSTGRPFVRDGYWKLMAGYNDKRPPIFADPDLARDAARTGQFISGKKGRKISQHGEVKAWYDGSQRPFLSQNGRVIHIGDYSGDKPPEINKE